MSIRAQVIKDSINSITDDRLSTFVVTFPRMINAEILRHRMLSFSSASSRAIPTKKIIEDVQNNPAMPVFWGKNIPGMQSNEELDNTIKTLHEHLGKLVTERDRVKEIWLDARNSAVLWAKKLMELGLHKQIANRGLEPYQNITLIITGTQWENFFALRAHCFSEDTEVLTLNGWKFFKDVTKQDLVYTLNPITNLTELSSINNIVSWFNNEDMISIQGQSVDLLTTKQHKHYISIERNKQNYCLELAENLNQYQDVFLQKNCNGFDGKKIEHFIIPSVLKQDKNQYGKYDPTYISEKVVCIKDFLKFLGFYLSDGYICETDGNYKIGFVKSSEDIISKYREIMFRLTDNTINCNKDNSKTIIEVCDKRLFDLIKNLNIGKTLEKYIPNFIWEFDSSLLLYLFEGLMDGDSNFHSNGNTHDKGLKYYTSSIRLANDIQRLCFLIGKSATITPRDRRGEISEGIDKNNKKYKITTKNICYYISINSSKNKPSIKRKSRNNIKTVPYSGNVYCIESANNHIIYVRRNGKTVWSGNCAAQPEFRVLAEMMLEEYNKSVPEIKIPFYDQISASRNLFQGNADKSDLEKSIEWQGGWHIPFEDKMPEGLNKLERLKIGIARCARVSYLTQDGEINTQKDFELYDRLTSSGHFSPCEHLAFPIEESKFIGNFKGWVQFRKLLVNENQSDNRVIKRRVVDGKVV